MSEEVATAQPPTILYKYLPPERIDILEDQELRFSPPSAFNDTFDSHYLAPKGKDAGRARIAFRSALGVLCLTERQNDHLMWVHYANNHKGFVIGFDASSPFFSEGGRVLRKVVYQNQPNLFSEPDIDATFRKSRVWEREDEWRCVRQFQQAEARNVRFEPTLVREIIFGAKMESWQISRIVLFMWAHNSDVKYLFSTPATKSWTFQLSAKHLTPCEACGTSGYIEGPQQS